jgi:hypothetical protein
MEANVSYVRFLVLIICLRMISISKKITFIKIIINEDYIINNNNKINLQYFKLHYLDKMNKS